MPRRTIESGEPVFFPYAETFFLSTLLRPQAFRSAREVVLVSIFPHHHVLPSSHTPVQANIGKLMRSIAMIGNEDERDARCVNASGQVRSCGCAEERGCEESEFKRAALINNKGGVSGGANEEARVTRAERGSARGRSGADLLATQKNTRWKKSKDHKPVCCSEGGCDHGSPTKGLPTS